MATTDARAKDLLDLGNKLFSDKDPLMSLCQNIAENIFPTRADFTTTINLGEDFAGNLMDSYPVTMHRELSDSISAMLRPRDKPWFRATTLSEELDNDEDNARFLEEVIVRNLRSGIYDPRSKFIRATKEGDRDFTAFGQAIISMEEAPNRDHLYVRTHHFRDCAWLENEIGEIDHLHRKDSMPARAMCRRFGDKNLSQTIRNAAQKEPGKACPFRVVIMPTDEYDYTKPDAKKGGKKLPFISIYIDADGGKVIKEAPLHDFIYVVPRWHTISGSQYAFSPAAITALPDARMAQSLALILLEAGEKMVDPPLIATEEAVREANLQAGGITWVDFAYDERLGEAVRPLKIDGDMRTGFAMRQDVREMLTKAFFVDKLQLPDTSTAKTAYEISQRIQEHVRNLIPLFEPMEVEYNVRLLDKAFSALRNMGRFDFSLAPKSLQGRDITWAFESPIQEGAKRLLTSQFNEVTQILAAAQQLGMTTMPVKSDVMVKDAIIGTSAPAKWRKSEAEIDEEKAAQAEAAKTQELAASVSQAAELAGQVSDASMRVGQAMQPINGGALKPVPQKALPAPRKAA